MPETKTATRPSRKRVETSKVEKPKAEKVKAPKAAEVEPETSETEEPVQRIRVILEHQGDTKTYSKWQPPTSSGCVGTYYAPLGTTAVKVLIEGPAS